MRMKDLVAASGLPRTTIHYYLREGVLPPPVKTSANAARYGPEHLERLALIRSLRSTELGPYSMAQIGAILRMVDGGVDPVVASASFASGLSSELEDLLPPGSSGEDLATASGVPEATVGALIDAGLLAEAPGGGFNAADALVTRSYSAILERTGLEVGDLVPIRDLLRELARYEETISRVAAARSESEDDASAEQNLDRMFQSVHRYLIIRHRSDSPE